MSYGPCLCGDTHCSSCGPAQGNWKCPLCSAWADDGCEHFEAYCKTCEMVIPDDDEENRCGAHGHDVEMRLKPEFQAKADELARQEAEAVEQMVKDIEESERLAEEYWRNYHE